MKIVSAGFHLVFSIYKIMPEDANVHSEKLQCRPTELDSGGSGVYCCIPLCKNATYNRNKQKSGTGFFRFPKDDHLRAKWTGIIKQFQSRKSLLELAIVYIDGF